MKPIGALMQEHRLIERMLRLIQAEMDRAAVQNKFDIDFIDTALDFLVFYADHNHHGKEEKLYFPVFLTKSLTPEHRRITTELIDEHARLRKTFKAISVAAEAYRQGKKDVFQAIRTGFGEVLMLYPLHVDKEDNHFFYPSMDYLTRQEQDKMLQDMICAELLPMAIRKLRFLRMLLNSNYRS